MRLAREAALKGNQNSLSDAGVAGLTGQACAEGAYYNVRINLPGIRDGEFKKQTAGRARELADQVLQLGDEIRKVLAKSLKD